MLPPLWIDFLPVNELTSVVKFFADWTRVWLAIGLAFSLINESGAAPAEMLSDQQQAALISQGSLLLQEITQLRSQKEWTKVFPLLQQYVELKQKVFGDFHSEVGDALFITGAMYRESGEAAKSIPYLQRSLAIREKRCQELTPRP